MHLESMRWLKTNTHSNMSQYAKCYTFTFTFAILYNWQRNSYMTFASLMCEFLIYFKV